MGRKDLEDQVQDPLRGGGGRRTHERRRLARRAQEKHARIILENRSRAIAPGPRALWRRHRLRKAPREPPQALPRVAARGSPAMGVPPAGSLPRASPLSRNPRPHLCRRIPDFQSCSLLRNLADFPTTIMWGRAVACLLPLWALGAVAAGTRGRDATVALGSAPANVTVPLTNDHNVRPRNGPCSVGVLTCRPRPDCVHRAGEGWRGSRVSADLRHRLVRGRGRVAPSPCEFTIWARAGPIFGSRARTAATAPSHSRAKLGSEPVPGRRPPHPARFPRGRPSYEKTSKGTMYPDQSHDIHVRAPAHRAPPTRPHFDTPHTPRSALAVRERLCDGAPSCRLHSHWRPPVGRGRDVWLGHRRGSQHL